MNPSPPSPLPSSRPDPRERGARRDSSVVALSGAGSERPGLVRALGARDGALLTVGATLGTAIFLVPADIAGLLPHPGLILLVWAAGGLLVLAGALTFAELGASLPRAGGQYQYLKEAYGPLWGFLFGWSAFLVTMTGAIAAIAVGFGEYLGGFVPLFSGERVIAEVPLGFAVWTVRGPQLAGALAILGLTAVNHVGLKAGAGLQSLLTIAKVACLLGFVVLGFVAEPTTTAAAAPLPASLLPAFGLAMISALWAYDGWYVLCFSAGEVRRPGRDLPLALVAGTVAILVLYTAVNAVYLRAVPPGELAGSPRVAEVVAGALFGPAGARAISGVVLLTIFGCLASNVLACSRIYQPMAEDGLFFRRVAAIHPRWRTPVGSLWAQATWGTILALTGTYNQLYTYAIFVSLVLQAATAAGVFVLRKRRPDLPRPYKVWGYPVVPALFILACLLLIGNTLMGRPVESLLGLAFLALGVPVYLWMRKRAAAG